MENRNFTKEQIIYTLEAALNRRLGEVDRNHVFERALEYPKITGIAGDVIEQSVLGYKPDNKRDPDIFIDGVPFEVKSTGLRIHNKKLIYIAKEPMTITAVSPKTIVNEDYFEASNFYSKINRLLIVYYHYNSSTTVPAIDYQDFPIAGYQFLNLEKDELEILKNDWKILRDFVRKIHDNFTDKESQYHRISSETRADLMYLDTAPKWPNPPRIRFKRSFLSNIVESHFKGNLEQTPFHFNSYEELDTICVSLQEKHQDKTVLQLLDEFGIDYKKITKAINEKIVVSMFEAKTKKINDIAEFNKAGVIGKTITLTEKGARTEDMKLFRIDFDEIKDTSISFENSTFYSYFSDHQFLCPIFEESSANPGIDNKFRRFIRFKFNDEFIDTDVRNLWDNVKALVNEDKLYDVIEYDKDGNPILNKTGVIRSAPNFPKMKNNKICVRGSSSDSKRGKSLLLNNIFMYPQYVWISGKYIANAVSNSHII